MARSAASRKPRRLEVSGPGDIVKTLVVRRGDDDFWFVLHTR
jgi:hypothetical protein